jgi:hypothetical protein
MDAINEIQHMEQKFILSWERSDSGDLTDIATIAERVRDEYPDYCYNLKEYKPHTEEAQFRGENDQTVLGRLRITAQKVEMNHWESSAKLKSQYQSAERKALHFETGQREWQIGEKNFR